MDESLVQRYADAVVALVRQDMISGMVSTEVVSFAELHDYVDANDYIDQVGVPWECGDYDLVNAVTDRVSQILRINAGS